jgi:hypothetical protein
VYLIHSVGIYSVLILDFLLCHCIKLVLPIITQLTHILDVFYGLILAKEMQHMGRACSTNGGEEEYM